MFPIVFKAKELKRRPRRVDLVIPPGSTFTLNDVPMGTWTVYSGGKYWRVVAKLRR
jgi:hypothetical protein